jgi:hypothetical protein
MKKVILLKLIIILALFSINNVFSDYYGNYEVTAPSP